MNALLSLDGVLRSPTGDVIAAGIVTYRAFKAVGRVILATSLERRQADAWCLTNNLMDHDDLIDGTVALDPDEPLRFRQLSIARARGAVDIYIDADPAYVAEGLRRGMTSLLFSQPSYARPEFRPDAPRGIRPWEELIAERTRQQAMIASDSRLFDDDPGGFE